MQTTSHFRFLVSSCVTPNFPYLPFHGRRIKGFDLLADYLSQPSSKESTINHEPTPSQNGSSEADDNSTESSTVQDPLFVPPSTEFMLFLGDFIYADVPVFFGDNQEAFRRLYRRNYQSQSFRKIYEQLRQSYIMLHFFRLTTFPVQLFSTLTTIMRYLFCIDPSVHGFNPVS